MSAQLAIRIFLPAVLLAVSLIGLWKGKRWGWIVALVADGALSANELWSLLDLSILASPRAGMWLSFTACDFLALVLLLSAPVRNHYLKGRRTSGQTISPALRAASRAKQTINPFRVLIYFCVASVATCTVTAFSLAVLMGQKSGGGKGFLVLLFFAFTTGFVASLLFALVLTVMARKFDPSRLGVWLGLGASLAPAVTVGLGLVGWVVMLASVNSTSPKSPFFGYLFFAPASLIQVGWLTLPVGICTASICYSIYPWAFLPSRVRT